MSEGLTDKQRVFVEEYLACWNATEAARRAGYSNARASGCENLAKPNIAALIEARITDKAMRADEVLARLADHARGDMRVFLKTNDDGTPTGFNLGEAKPLHLVKKVSITDKGVSFELYDAQSALALLAKHHSLLVDRAEVNGRVAIEYVNDWRAEG